MSGPASRSRVLAVQRHRRSVARELAPFISDGELRLFEDDSGRLRVECPHCEPYPEELRYACVACGGDGSTPADEALTRGIVVRPDGTRQLLAFDAHAAREHARSLIALKAEQDAFEDWARALGKGPENREPGAFVPDGCFACGRSQPASCSSQCLACAQDACHNPDCREEAPLAHGFAQQRGGWPGPLAAQWARQGGDRRAPMGRSLARLGRHILAALEGQPSECGSCIDQQPTQTFRFLPDMRAPSCQDCHGTRHNLRGVLPPRPPISPQLRRRRADQGTDDEGIRNTSDTWLGDADITGHMAPGWGLFRHPGRWGWGGNTSDTRVAPRGDAMWEPAPDANPWLPLPDQVRGASQRRANGEPSAQHDAHVRAWVRWRTWSRSHRGELLHAEQRRERARLVSIRFDGSVTIWPGETVTVEGTLTV